MHRLRGIIIGLLSGLLWAASGLALGYAMEPASSVAWADGLTLALGAALAHDASAAVTVTAVLGVTKGILPTTGLPKGTIRGLGVGALAGSVIGTLCYAGAVMLAGTAAALAATAAYPVVAALLAMVILRERHAPRAWWGVGAAALGFVFLGLGTDAGVTPHMKLGLLLALGCVFGWSFEGAMASKAMRAAPSLQAIAVRETVSAALLAGLLVLVLPWGGGLTLDWGWALAAGCFGGVSYWAWYEAMRCLGMARGVALNITYAAWSVLWGMLGLCAPLEGMLPLVGAALVLVGGLLAAFSERGGRKRAF